jgi:ABC-type lipoprotein release transport system permease subunit
MLVAGGAVIGAAASLLLRRPIAGLLFGVDAIDPLSLGLVVGLLAVVTVVASLVPALRALRVEPISALRYE